MSDQKRISNAALVRYEAEYERVLYMEKAYEMFGSEHQRMARRAMLEMAAADFNAAPQGPDTVRPGTVKDQRRNDASQSSASPAAAAPFAEPEAGSALPEEEKWRRDAEVVAYLVQSETRGCFVTMHRLEAYGHTNLFQYDKVFPLVLQSPPPSSRPQKLSE